MKRHLSLPENKSAFQIILQAEINYLKRSRVGQRSQLQRGFTWIVVLVALIAFVWRVADTIPQQPSLLNWLLFQLKFDVSHYFLPGGLNETVFPIVLLFSLCVLIWDLWLMFETLVMSTNSIAREKKAKNLDLLLLTNVNPRQIVMAKWRAIIRQQWHDYALLAIMRIGAVSLLAMSFSIDFTPSYFPYFSFGSPGPTTEPDRTTVFLIAISIVILSAVIIAMLTMLNLMFTAACGMVSGSISKRPALSLPYSIGVRLLLVTIVAALIGIPGYIGLKPDIETFNYYPDPVFNTICLILSLIGVTMIDHGGIAAGLLMRFGYYFRWWSAFYGFQFFSDTVRGHGPAFLTALLLSIVIFGVLTYILLRQAELISSRQRSE